MPRIVPVIHIHSHTKFASNQPYLPTCIFVDSFVCRFVCVQSNNRTQRVNYAMAKNNKNKMATTLSATLSQSVIITCFFLCCFSFCLFVLLIRIAGCLLNHADKMNDFTFVFSFISAIAQSFSTIFAVRLMDSCIRSVYVNRRREKNRPTDRQVEQKCYRMWTNLCIMEKRRLKKIMKKTRARIRNIDIITV